MSCSFRRGIVELPCREERLMIGCRRTVREQRDERNAFGPSMTFPYRHTQRLPAVSRAGRKLRRPIIEFTATGCQVANHPDTSQGQWYRKSRPRRMWNSILQSLPSRCETTISTVSDRNSVTEIQNAVRVRLCRRHHGRIKHEVPRSIAFPKKANGMRNRVSSNSTRRPYWPTIRTASQATKTIPQEPTSSGTHAAAYSTPRTTFEKRRSGSPGIAVSLADVSVVVRSCIF